MKKSLFIIFMLMILSVQVKADTALDAIREAKQQQEEKITDKASTPTEVIEDITVEVTEANENATEVTEDQAEDSEENQKGYLDDIKDQIEKAKEIDLDDLGKTKEETEEKKQTQKEDTIGDRIKRQATQVYSPEEIDINTEKLKSKIDKTNRSLLDIVYSICKIPISIVYAFYAIGEIGLVALWSICIILIFLTPKKFVIVKNFGIGFSKVCFVYTLIYIIARIVLK